METKELRIVPPEGYEIDRDKSTLDHIIFKEINPCKDYKKGDFLVIVSDRGDKWITIYKDVDSSTVNGYYCICKKNSPLYLTSIEGSVEYNQVRVIDKRNIDYIRLATSEEKNVLLNKINELGYYWDDENLELKRKSPIPNTWEEFVKNYPIKTGECFIDEHGHAIEYFGKRQTRLKCEKTTLPSIEYAEAIIALCQLIQLRNCYNEGWEPDWTDNEFKYELYAARNEICKDEGRVYHHVLSFKTAELRDKFFNNFRDLIETAKILL